MKVAIIGSRDFPRLSMIDAYVAALPPDTTVISGGARGADRRAVYAAQRRGLATEEYEPDLARYGSPRAYVVRNRQIVAAADKVVAFWDGASNGTAMTLRFAREAGKPVEIVRPA
jgi:predicted Rossmann fold nucleotide-binding protein DprA/Smf involved in DNA uptake